jgi:uncharacterized membrane protein (TIGR02234 family)
LLLGLAGAGLALWAATRTWSLLVIDRPGLPALRTATTGAEDFPLLIGLALVALAGVGALLATRGLVRRVLGGLLAAVGAGLAVQAITGRAGLDVGRAGAGATIWPVVCVVGGAMIVVGGLAAARQGHRWPTMGSRYERRNVPSAPSGPGDAPGPQATASPDDQSRSALAPADNRAVWDALDRGDDPTAR